MPTITLEDLVSHPAYKRYILNMTLKEIERMRVIVSIHNWRLVTDRVSRFRLSKRVPIEDGFDHYIECVWSDPNCKTGPDTCVCSDLSGECYTIIRLLDKLKDEDSTASAETGDKRYGL